MRPILIITAVALATALAPQARGAADVATEVEPGLLKELKALDEKLVKVEDLRGSFTQQKHTALLKEPLTSSGNVIVKGQRMRWDVEKPTPSTTVTSPGEVRIHFPRQKVIEVYGVDDRLSSVIASPLPRLDVLLKNFRIERRAGAKDDAEVLSITLKPRSDELAKHLSRVEVRIDRATALAASMEMVDADDERLVITFSNLKENTKVKDEEFELKAPAGTKVVRPLEGIERGSK